MVLTKKQRDVVRLTEGWYKLLGEAENSDLYSYDAPRDISITSGNGVTTFTYFSTIKSPEKYRLRTSIVRTWSKEQISGKQKIRKPRGPMKSFRLAGKYAPLEEGGYKIYPRPEVVLYCNLDSKVSASMLREDIKSAYEVVDCMWKVTRKQKTTHGLFIIGEINKYLRKRGITNVRSSTFAVEHAYLSYIPRKKVTCVTLRVPYLQQDLPKILSGIVKAKRKGLEKIITKS